MKKSTWLAYGLSLLLTLYTMSATAQWTIVGAANFSNGDTYESNMAFNPSNNQPYVVYKDGSYGGKLVAKRYNGTAWVDVGSSTGFTAGNMSQHVILAFQPGTNEPYVVYRDIANGTRTNVMRFDGTNWVNVGSPVSPGSSGWPSITFHPVTAQPYVIYSDWTDNQKATVKRFDGTNWVLVGAEKFTAGIADVNHLAFHLGTNEPYLCYQGWSGADAGRLSVMRFDGTNWVFLANSQNFTAGEAANAHFVFKPTTNEPHVVFKDVANSSKGSLMRYDGTNWVHVGSAGFTPNQANFPKLAFQPSTNEPHVAFQS